MDKNFDPLKHGIALINLGAEEGKIKGAPEAIEKLSELCHQPKGNAFSQLQQFRKMVPIILNYIIWQKKIIDRYTKIYDQMVAKMSAKHRKKWTPEEDELLIEIVARGEESISEVALMFGRSAGAIATRVSYLVGIKKVSEEVAGKFVGSLDGKHVEGVINGTVRKDI